MDDEDLAFLPGPPAPSLTASSSFSTIKPLHVSTPHSGAYILQLADIGTSYAASFSAPRNAISLLDKASFREVGSLAGHEAGITALEVLPDKAGLLSSSSEGTVRYWDPRARKSVSTFRPDGPKHPALLSVAASCDGAMVAAGSELQGDDAMIFFWDLRNPGKALYSHTSTHSDDITSLAFHPSKAEILLSGSTDGLLSLTNAKEADEDEAVVEVANWGTSLAGVCWSQTGGKVGGRSDMETLGVWDGELTLLHDYGDARRPTVAGQWTTDYLVQCDFRDEELLILAGSNDGAFAQICASSPSSWVLERAYAGGHSAIVRTVLFDERHGRMLSGGEDGQVAAWSAEGGIVSNATEGEEEKEDDEMEVDTPQRPKRGDREPKSPGSGEHKARKKTRYEPYGRR